MQKVRSAASVPVHKLSTFGWRAQTEVKQSRLGGKKREVRERRKSLDSRRCNFLRRSKGRARLGKAKTATPKDTRGASTALEGASGKPGEALSKLPDPRSLESKIR